MNHQRRETILCDIENRIASLRQTKWDTSVATSAAKLGLRRTIPANILAPVLVFTEDQLNRNMPGAWLSLATIQEGFFSWLKAIDRKNLIAQHTTMVQFGRCLSQALQLRSERRRIGNHQVRGFPVWPQTQEDGEDFFARLYE